MAVWGAPVAQEDDAERAVRAALELVAAVEALGAERCRALRCGRCLTGEAAVTLGAEGEGMVAGDLVNTAVARPVGRRARARCSSATRRAARARPRSPTRTPARTS